jgi:ABC-2 type transport system ATP-binding protein
MKQKLALACTLVHEPALILLDEPTTGVDPISRREFWKLLSEFLSRGVTILMSTPYLDEAERCTRVAFMDKGHILALGTPAQVKRLMRGALIEVRTPNARQAAVVLRREIEAQSVGLFGDRVHVVARDAELTIAAAEAALTRAGLETVSVRSIAPSLEDVFVSVLAAEPESAHA